MIIPVTGYEARCWRSYDKVFDLPTGFYGASEANWSSATFGVPGMEVGESNDGLYMWYPTF